MRIAIPISDGMLAQHFGHCERFAFADVDATAKTVVRIWEEPAPAHEPGLLPRWLEERGACVIIAGGMGSRARALFQESGIEVVTGAASEAPQLLVAGYLAGTLSTGANACDH